MRSEVETMIRSLSGDELTELRTEVQKRVDDSRHAYGSLRKATQETSEEYFKVIDDEIQKRAANG